MRLGIMGGTFDPIHYGHLVCAERAACALGLDKVVFMPAGNPHFKLGQDMASALDRLAMCELACMPNQLFCVSDAEVVRAGVTYTIDTVLEMHSQLPDAELFFVIGSDAALTLPQWRRAEELSRLVTFAVLMRPGDDRARIDRLAASSAFAIEVIECPLLDISSSYLRKAVGEGRSIRYLTPDAVCAYIEDRALYGRPALDEWDGSGEAAADLAVEAGGDVPPDPLSEAFFEMIRGELATRVGKKRLTHIEGVSDTARSLARLYGVDETKAVLAGLLHDWDKGYDDDAMRRRVAEVGLAEVLDPFVVADMPQVLHGPTAAFALKARFPKIPGDVIRAIYYHTTGAHDATDLDKILYIADAIEPTRTFGEVEGLREEAGRISLDELYFHVYQFWTMALVERGRVLHPDTISLWNELAVQAARRRADKKAKKNKKAEK